MAAASKAMAMEEAEERDAPPAVKPVPKFRTVEEYDAWLAAQGGAKIFG